MGRSPTVATAPIETITVLVAAPPTTEQFRKMTMRQVAVLTGKDPVDVMLDIAVTDELRTLFFAAPPRNIGPPQGDRGQPVHALRCVRRRCPHEVPDLRSLPTETLAQQVRDNHWITYEEAHRRLSGLPAQLAGFHDRGPLRLGGPADAAVYDPQQLSVGPNEVVEDLPGGEWQPHPAGVRVPRRVRQRGAHHRRRRADRAASGTAAAPRSRRLAARGAASGRPSEVRVAETGEHARELAMGPERPGLDRAEREAEQLRGLRQRPPVEARRTTACVSGGRSATARWTRSAVHVRSRLVPSTTSAGWSSWSSRSMA